jgi:Mannosyltransferase putative/Glycosyltransferase family 9 (heptosyltransferase)
MRRLVLECDLPLGDVVLLTAAVRDLQLSYPGQFLVDVRTRFPAVWQNNPYLTPIADGQSRVVRLRCQYPLIQHANAGPFHVVHGFIAFLNEALGLTIRPSRMRGDLHLTADERAGPSPICAHLGQRVPYWILGAGGKYDYTIKWWSARRFQAVVDRLRERVLFVQVGHLDDYHPRLSGVLDLCGRTTTRQLIHWIAHAQGVLCPVTALMHLAAATETVEDPGSPCPCVVVAGGREPPHWEAYPEHQFIHTVGALACCRQGGCWKSRTFALGDGSALDRAEHRCVDVVDRLPRCMDMITVDEVVRRVELYFTGGVRRPLAPAERRIAARTADVVPLRPGCPGFDQLREVSEGFLQAVPPAPSFRSRVDAVGVVMAAGGPHYLPMAWAAARMLRRVGCSWPLEIWHLGPGEIDPASRALFHSVGATFRDALAVAPLVPMGRMGGWELKAFALAHTCFRQVLLLDADTVPVRSPEGLLEEPGYRRTGALFWPDRGRLQPERSVWPMCGIPYRDEPEFESGQIWVDRKRCWRALVLALWYNAHSELVYRHVHGDKETFHLAFRKLDQPYALIPGPVRYEDGIFYQTDSAGQVLFQHWSGAKRANAREPDFPEGFLYARECRMDLAEWHDRLRVRKNSSPIQSSAFSRFDARPRRGAAG